MTASTEIIALAFIWLLALTVLAVLVVYVIATQWRDERDEARAETARIKSLKGNQ